MAAYVVTLTPENNPSAQRTIGGPYGARHEADAAAEEERRRLLAHGFHFPYGGPQHIVSAGYEHERWAIEHKASRIVLFLDLWTVGGGSNERERSEP